MKSKIKGMTDTEYTAHMKHLAIFTDCKEVKSVPSKNKRKVQRKTNKPRQSNKSNVQAKVQWEYTTRTYNMVEALLD